MRKVYVSLEDQGTAKVKVRQILIVYGERSRSCAASWRVSQWMVARERSWVGRLQRRFLSSSSWKSAKRRPEWLCLCADIVEGRMDGSASSVLHSVYMAVLFVLFPSIATHSCTVSSTVSLSSCHSNGRKSERMRETMPPETIMTKWMEKKEKHGKKVAGDDALVQRRRQSMCQIGTHWCTGLHGSGTGRRL